MEIKQDERVWEVVLRLNSKKCPYIYYPADYHGCKILSDIRPGEDYCVKERCPMRNTNEEA